MVIPFNPQVVVTIVGSYSNYVSLRSKLYTSCGTRAYISPYRARCRVNNILSEYFIIAKVNKIIDPDLFIGLAI